MEYYLDTSVVRRGRARLNDCLPGLPCTTSALTVVELVSSAWNATTARAYGRPRAALSLIREESIRVDWRLPERLVFESFSRLGRYSLEDSRGEWLKDVASLIMECSSPRVLRERLGGGDLLERIEFFASLDGDISSGFVTATRDGARDVRRLFKEADAEQAELLRGYGVEMQEGFGRFTETMTLSIVDRSVVLYALAELACRLVGDGGIPEENIPPLREVYQSYNGNLDRYVDAMSVAGMEHFRSGGQAARNDGVDVTHFMYAREGVVLATGDKHMLQWARSIDWASVYVSGGQ